MSGLKEKFSKSLKLILAIAITFTTVSMSSIEAFADSRVLKLTGLINQNTEGYINSKAVIVGETNAKASFSLTPAWAQGTSYGTRVVIQLPSLNYVDGEYVKADSNGDVGIRGTVASGSGYRVIGDTVSDGGQLVLEYEGGLSAGNNPAFEVNLKTYSKNPDLSIPEGTKLDLYGYVSYDNFNQEEGTGWGTPGAKDGDSEVNLIVSNLEWDAELISVLEEGETVDTVPIWDRYQYVAYDYLIENISDNTESMIEGFNTTFDIDSTSSEINGIIPFDINRFSYIDGKPVKNEDPDKIKGQFIGVPGEGGVLIYDITDTVDNEDPTEGLSPIPYVYSGSGMIEISQRDKEIAPDGQRVYRLSLPLSRQGFPNVPTKFKVRSITNILFAQGVNWTKTHISEREILDPVYDVEFNHEYEKETVVYGYETYFELKDIINDSNVPVFTPTVDYKISEDYNQSKLKVSLPKDAEYTFLDIFNKTFITYDVLDKDGKVEHKEITLPESFSTDADGSIYFEVDMSKVEGEFKVHYKESFKKYESQEYSMELYGNPTTIGHMTNTATLVYIEKQASNDELGDNTTYTDIPHEVVINRTIEVIFPEEVRPSISMKINQKGGFDKENVWIGNGTYGKNIDLDYYFGTNNEQAKTGLFEAAFNTPIAIHDAKITLKSLLFESAKDVKVFAVDSKGVETELTFDLSDSDVVLELPLDTVSVKVTTGEFKTDGEQHLIVISGLLDKETAKSHDVDAKFSTYQEAPYDKTSEAEVKGRIIIELPHELNPDHKIETYYGDLKSNNVSYESIFEARFKLNTKGVTSPDSTYTIDLQKPSKDGYFNIKSVEIREDFVTEYKSYDIDGNEYINELPYDKVLTKIVVHYKNLKTDELVDIVTMKVKADIDMGSFQEIKGTFKGSQEKPFLVEKISDIVHRVTVFDTKTSIEVKGVNQVDEKLGVGNKYSVDIYRHWNRGYTYNTQDWTLDQGYKSLGGFTNSITRPTQTYANNDQTLTISTQLPNHFDLYYLKIRNEMENYITSVNVYREVDGEEVLWQSIDGDKWVNNTTEGNFWRINTALIDNKGDDLFATHDTTQDVYEHPYFKSAWHEDVRPSQPITKVDIILDFERLSENDAPQMAGAHKDIIEYMGRFHSTSEKKEATPVDTLDTFGVERDQTRNHEHTINSLVGFPFAKTSTGAHDNTSLARKQILMGTVGEYKTSIQNLETFSVPYYSGHGPDIYIPVATEHDEWLQMRNSGFFHDTLIYEFTYPTRPSQDDVYNYDSTYFVVENTKVNKYLDKLVIFGEDKSEILIDSIDIEGAVRVNYKQGETAGYEINDGQIDVTLPEGESPLRFEAYFKEIQGFGERTSEIDGTPQDQLGTLADVDIRIGGIVNGDKDLTGTTKLYRLPDDSKVKTLLGTTSAKLAGITPKLNAQLGMTYDNLKVYDFGADGITPNTTTVDLTILNRGEADITDVDLTFTPDTNFRTQTLSIPKEIFESDYYVDSVIIDTVNVTEYFELEGDKYVLDLVSLFEQGILKQSTYKQNGLTFNKLDSRSIKVNFKPDAEKDVRMFGKFTKDEREDQDLPSVMIDGSIVTATGIWVDQSTTGEWDWTSAPSFTSEGTKATREGVTSYTTFNVSAVVTPYQSIYVSSGSGNQGEKPTLTHSSINGSNVGPRLYNRLAQLDLTGNHLNEDMSISKDNNIFYDADTDKQVSYTNLTVGDTTYLVYRLNNSGKLAADDLVAGDLPVFNPYFEVNAPSGLKIVDAWVLDELTDYIDAEGFVSAKVLEDKLTDKKYSVTFDNTLDFKESVYAVVKFETINDFGKELGDTQNKTMVWQSHARPEKTHNYFSYNGYGRNDHRTVGRTDVRVDNQHFANVYNTTYRFANPSKLRIASKFLNENVSGKEALLTVQNIENETLHDNTQLEVLVTLDKNKDRLVAVQENTYGGFELTKFPKPETMEGYNNPVVYFDFEGEFIKVSDFDSKIHDMKDINQLKVDYGIVSADFVAPNFSIEGIGHWKTVGSLTTKNYDIYSVAKLTLTHDNYSEYSFTTETSNRVWKAIAQTELNLQAFETKAEAQGEYNGPLVGKHSYKPGDSFYYKLSLLNIDNQQGLNTNTPYGKADLLNPVIYDKIPEYISYEDVEIKIFDAQGNEREFVRPTITTKNVKGLDVGGSQTFANDRHNDGYGRISTQEPSNTKINKADEIDFTVVEYHFAEDDLKRGERLEITYKATARENDLPYAKYPNGNAVFAPFIGWYEKNYPASETFKDVTMDMASLLHDVGVSGNKGHELAEVEFLSNSSSWTHGGLDTRHNATNTYTKQLTYYDDSANKEKSHKAYMNEEKTNDLHTTFGSGLEEVYQYLTTARINDNQVVSNERIMWAQNGMQLQRAWLYGASEMVPEVERKTHGIDDANYYEHDGSLNHVNIQRWSYTPYNYDDYTYAVDLHEIFTIKLHAANMGDRAIESGLKYTEILPIGISPFAEDGSLLGISTEKGEAFTYEIIQSPDNDQGYRAPAQNQEAGTLSDKTREEIPYVIEVKVPNAVSPWFKGSNTDKYQQVNIKVRVDHRIAPNADLGVHKDMSVFYDQLQITPLSQEEYMEIYSHEYGAFTRGVDTSTWSQNAKYYRNDAIKEGLELNHAWLSSHNYTTYLSFEPYGMYIRGLNAQNTRVDNNTLVTGDQIAAKQPTLRTWVNPEKLDKTDDRYGTIDNFDVNLYDELKLHATIENQQLEVRPEYNRLREGYNYYSGDNLNDDIWINAPQTIGGARGGLFEPRVNMTLPKGFAPIDSEGNAIRTYHETLSQELDFEAGIYKVTGLHTKELVKDVTEFLDTKVTLNDGVFGLEFIVDEKKAVDVPYEHILIVTPKVKVIDNFEGNVELFVSSDRDVFTPIVSKRYTTGDVPSTTARDVDTRVLGRNNVRISENDRKRPDSTSTWSNNMGVIKVTEKLIKESQMKDESVFGETEFKLRQASIWNVTKTLNYADGSENDVSQVDPAGKHWYLTEVKNDVIKNANPYIESHSAGDVHHSRFLMTYIVSDFAKVTENVKIKIGDDIFDPEDIGFDVEYIKTEKFEKGRNKVQFIVTPENGTLLSQDSFKFLFEVLLVDGFKDEIGDGDVWKSDDLKVDSYVSLITDDKTVGTVDEKNFIIQDESMMNYRTHVTDENLGFNLSGNDVSDYAHNSSKIEIIKPKLAIRKNTYRSRELYSNGLTGDNYFNAVDTIDYIINHVEVTGGSVKEVIVEDIIPTNNQTESSISISRLPIQTDVFEVTTGVWELPQSTLDRIEKAGKSAEDLYKVYVYDSNEDAIDGYETEGWELLNPEGTSIYTNEVLKLDLGTKKVRVVLRALDHENFLIPTGTKLAVDADPEMEGNQTVLETDPDNLNVELMDKGVVDNSIRLSMTAKSDHTATLFIYNNAQAWANYVSDATVKLDQSETRSYLTPSRPVVNVKYNAMNFRSTDDNQYGWSNNTNINPHQLPHMKFKAEFINANDTMWNEEESNAYKQDLLRDPFITFELPKVMSSLQGKMKFVEDVDTDSPLHEDFTNKYGLTDASEGLWTWYLNKADGSRSEVKLEKEFTGSWSGSQNNVVSLWFSGDIAPGDSIVVEFIGAVNYFALPVKGDLQSKAKITNNTGLLTPLNSFQNMDNKLGYMVDELDLNENKSTSDRLVFAERDLFTYESVDNFKKTKRSYSDLNLAGTEYPEITPVKQGGVVTFETAIDNSQEAENRTYPYPIFYDVLPYDGDTTIFNKDVPRNSKLSGLLLTDTINLSIEGAETKDFKPNEYTVFVGPFKKTGTRIDKVDLPEGAETEQFYNDLKTPSANSAFRNDHFVTLADFNKYAAGRDVEIQSVLVMFNNANYQMPSRSKIKLTYDMKSRINAPVVKSDDVNIEDFSMWNSFAATQRIEGFRPQESNLAGAYTVELGDTAYFGGYIWNDRNINGQLDEGEVWIDENGRTLLKPNPTDYGINGVKITLTTEKGYDVDDLGRPIHFEDESWYVVDEDTGKTVIDETFLLPIKSNGPTVRYTEDDYYGNAGHYVFSNLPFGKYYANYEFDPMYNNFGITTQKTVEIKEDVLKSKSPLLDLTVSRTDKELMEYDIGIANQLKIGGNVFVDKNVNGYNDKAEAGYVDATVTLEDVDGNIIKDQLGNDVITKTDDKGNYEFVITPMLSQYVVSVETGNENVIVSPIVHNIDPLKASNDNDAFTHKEDTKIQTNTINLDLEELYTSKFKDKLSVSIGVYDFVNEYTIGNRVWNDINQNGLQDENEPGIKGQKLHIEQYLEIDGGWVKQKFTKTATSNDDGFYYFSQLPDRVNEFKAGYKVYVTDLVTGYNITLQEQGEDQNIDNNFDTAGFIKDMIVLTEDNNSIDLGLHIHKLGIVSGDLFLDENQNSTHDADEKSTDDYLIILERRLGSESWKQVESIVGNSYEFTELDMVKGTQAYEYRVVIKEIPVWFKLADYQVGDDQTIDSDFTDPLYEKFLTVATREFKLNNDPKIDGSLIDLETFTEGIVEDIDLGLVKLDQTKLIGDYLWYDMDRNGIQDEGEQPLVDMPVHLYRIVGGKLVHVEETKTDEFGKYVFEADLADFDASSKEYNKPYEYVVLFNRLSRHELTKITSDDLLNSDFFKASDIYKDAPDSKHSVASRLANLGGKRGDYVDYLNTQDDLNIDGGVYLHDTILTIGDTVFNDINRNGVQDAGESGIGSIEIELYQDGTLMSTTETDDNGNYVFEVEALDLDKDSDSYLEVYKYEVIVKVPSNFRLTSSNFEYVDATDVKSKEITLIDADADLNTQRDDLTQDAGFAVYDTEAKLSGIVWEDLNEDGVISEGEKLYEDYKVELYKDGVKFADTVTDKDGRYEFTVTPTNYDKLAEDYLVPYEFVVKVERLGNQVFTKYLQGSVVEIDSNINSETNHIGVSDVFEVFTQGDVSSIKDDLDMGAGLTTYETKVTLDGVIWSDTDQDGSIEDELRLEKRVVTLWKKVKDEWVAEGTAVTDKNGYYSFEVAPTEYDLDHENYLIPYEYKVSSERLPNELWTVLENDNSFNEIGESTVFDIYTQGDVSSVKDDVRNGGLNIYETEVIIGGTVWEDKNFDGLRSNDEDRYEDYKVNLMVLKDNEWHIADTAKTKSDGTYEFIVKPAEYTGFNLNEISYKVSVEIEGYQSFAPYKQGDDITVDSNVQAVDTPRYGETDQFDIVDVNEGIIDITTLRNDTQMDIGIKTYGTEVKLGGIVWEDENFDGIMDPVEERIEGQEITLWKFVNGEWIKDSETQSDANGYYEFTVTPTDYDSLDLPLYEYKISVERMGNQEFSPYTQGDDHTVDSNVLGQRPTHTGNSDHFDIYDVLDGKVDISTLRNDLNMGIGLTTHETKVKVGGIVWEDENFDGILHEEEVGLEKEVTLWKLEGDDWVEVERVNTDENGYYEFEVDPTNYELGHEDYLKPYKYKASVVRDGNQLYSPYQVDQIENSSNVLDQRPLHIGYLDIFEIFEGNNPASIKDDLNKNAGIKTYKDSVIIGGIVWADDSLDGIMDETEAIHEGEAITLWKKVDDEWVEFDHTHTDVDGYYEFEVAPTNYDLESEDYLEAYEYMVTVQRDGYEVFSPLETEDNTLISEDLHIGRTKLFDVFESGNPQSVKDYLEMHIGYTIYENLVNVGGTVWEDDNYNGIMDEDELRYNEKEVELWLFNEVSQEWEFKDSTLTNENGYYEFEVVPTQYDINEDHYLVPYKYQARIRKDGNQVFSELQQGEDLTLDSDVIEEINLIGMLIEFDIFDEGQPESLRDDLNKGAGLKSVDPMIEIGDTVWFDENENGLFDTHEIGMSGIIAHLERYNENSKSWDKIDSTKTDANGRYLFNTEVASVDPESEFYLQPYKHRVSVEIPKGYKVTKQVAGDNNSKHVDWTEFKATTSQADNSELTIAGLVDLLTLSSDHSLDIGLVRQAEHEMLPPTGVGNLSVIYTSLIIAGVVMLIVSNKKRKRMKLNN